MLGASGDEPPDSGGVPYRRLCLVNQRAEMSSERRALSLKDFDEVKAELQSVADSGYEMAGEWTLGQICRHLRLDLTCSMDGYPKWMSLFAPVRPLMRAIFLPRVLRFESPSGMKTMSAMVPPGNLDDDTELRSYLGEIDRFHGFSGRLHTHPGFGLKRREDLERIYAAHAAHHLSFLIPN